MYINNIDGLHVDIKLQKLPFLNSTLIQPIAD